MTAVAEQSGSGIQFLVSAIWPRNDLSRCWIVTYKVFYDASGSETDASGVLALCCYAAPAAKWLRFDDDWKAMLDEERIPALHMKTLIDDLKKAHPDDDPHVRAEALFSRAIRVMKNRHLNKMLSISVDLAAYQEVNREYMLNELYGKGYSFVAAVCMREAQEWVIAKHRTDPILHVFECGDNGQEEFRDALPLWPEYSHAFLPKYDERTGLRVRPFEALDYLGWEIRRALVDHAVGKRARPRMHEIHRLLKTNDHHYTAPELRAVCETFGVARRTSTGSV